MTREMHGARHTPGAIYFTCKRHDKLTYPVRREARAASRRLHDKGVREYECDRYPGCWHIGHMPLCVRRGEMTASEFYALPKAQQARLRAAERAEGPGSREPDPS